MSKFVVVVFPNEAKAQEGTRAFRSLHEEGSLSLYGIAVLVKDATGKVETKEEDRPGPRGTALGALLGGLVGLIGGPAVAALGAAGGALAGGWRDALHAGVATDFLDEVSRELRPGRSAVVAEVAEEWVTPLDARMEAIGGVVLRTRPADLEAERIAQEAEGHRADLEQREAERAQAGDQAGMRLQARVDEARAKLRATAERAKAAIDRLEAEADAKLAALQEQATTATADAKGQIEQRITELRADRDRRAAKLRQAWDLAKEALG